jgi:NAD(P)-dependent dehydrogenase (short-subunit alcohol dehydrogenase family)
MNRMSLLGGKVAIVTGAGAGLGRAYALALAREGAAVVVNDFARTAQVRVSPAEQVVREIEATGGRAVANLADVGTIPGGQSLLDSAVGAFGGVDILVNNAGILRDGTLAKMPEADWDAVIRVHLRGVYAATKPVFSHMKEQGRGGVIVNKTSTAGLRGKFGQVNYGAAKAGIWGFSSSLALEGKKYGIRVWTIGPAAATGLTDHMSADYKRTFSPDRVAPTLIYMVSELSGDQTGKTLLAGGGWIGEVRMEVHPGYVPSEGFDAYELKRAVEQGLVMMPERDPNFVNAYGPAKTGRATDEGGQAGAGGSERQRGA